MKKYLLLFFALAIGSFLRLYQLSSVPNGLTWDEAAIGYNAYSILKTGRDEHGAFLPVIFKSFGDYKPGAYIYLTVPSVAIFGLNEFAVRFPSALFGILSIIGVYILVKELFSESHTKYTEQLAQITALTTAVSPWLVHFSHGAWEVNIFVTLTIFSLYFLLRFIKGHATPYPSMFFICLSLAMYQASKMLTPMLILLFITVYWKSFCKQVGEFLTIKNIFLSIPFVVFGLWIILGSVFGKAGNRLTTLSIFNYKPAISVETRQIDNNDNLVSSLFHNQKQLTAKLIASRYLWHFSPEVLFFEGRIISERGHIPSLGVLNPAEFILLLLGVVFLVQSKNKKTILVVLGLLFISPVPASLTLAEFSTVRALFMAVPLSIISGLGVYYIFCNSKALFTLICIVFAISIVYVYDIYFLHSKAVFAWEFNDGHKQAIQIIKDNPADKVIFSDVYGQPYIYYLFYTQYPPEKYQNTNHFIDMGLDVGRVASIENIEFRQFGNDELEHYKNSILIGVEGNIRNDFDRFGANVEFYKQIETVDHKIIFRIVKTK